MTCDEGHFSQKMFSGVDRANFVNNAENKNELIKLLCYYFQTDEYRDLFKIPLIINSLGNIYKISKETIEGIPILKCREA